MSEAEIERGLRAVLTEICYNHDETLTKNEDGWILDDWVYVRDLPRLVEIFQKALGASA